MLSDIEREERNVHKAIKDSVKRNDLVTAKVKYETLLVNLIQWWKKLEFLKCFSALCV